MLSLMVAALFAERRVLVEELTRLARADGLTGISNRRYFFERGEQELARARRYGKQPSMLLIDIDRFKQVNDQFGHAAGEEAICAVARCCMQVARATDLVGRLGGEEFALLLPETTVEGAREVAERLRALIASASLVFTDGPLRLTASIGVAAFRDEPQLALLCSRADHAMYAAKRGGGNQVRLADDAVLESFGSRTMASGSLASQPQTGSSIA